MGWEDASLQARVCALFGARPPDGSVSDVLIFAHSMGSLILAAALHNSRCTLRASVAWCVVHGKSVIPQRAALSLNSVLHDHTRE